MIQLAISLGVEGIPLACIGAEGYLAALLFWMITPIVLVALAILVGALYLQFVLQWQASVAGVLASVAPTALRFFFVSSFEHYARP